MLPHCPFWPGKLNFILYRLTLIHLRGYEHTRFPATDLPPIVAVLGGRDDIQRLMTLSLHHWCTSSRALRAI